MKKIDLIIIAAVVVAVGYGLVASFNIQSAPENRPITVSVEKNAVNYDDTLRWSVKGLPANAGYVATLRFPGTALIVGSGNADGKGEATGAIPIGKNIPAGPLAFRIELESDGSKFHEVPVELISKEGTTQKIVVLSVEKSTVNYNDTENWTVKGLPPNASYVATLRLAGTAAIIGKGITDQHGEASGSFVVGQGLPAGTIIFRVELETDPAQFDEVSITIMS